MSQAFGIFAFEQCDVVEPGVVHYEQVRLLQSLDVHEAGTRFEWATIDATCGVLALRGKKATHIYKLAVEATERITARDYEEMREEGDEE